MSKTGQLGLFGSTPSQAAKAPSRSRKLRAGKSVNGIAWESSGGPTCGKRFWYGDTGWWIEHCGHPTAIRPYLIMAPDGHPVYAPNGAAWRLSFNAKQAVEKLHAGMPENRIREWIGESEQWTEAELAAEEETDDEESHD